MGSKLLVPEPPTRRVPQTGRRTGAAASKTPGAITEGGTPDLPPEHGAAPEDFWSRGEPKQRTRALLLLLLNLGLYSGLCIFTCWLHIARPFDFSLESYLTPLRVSSGANTQNLTDFILSPISVERTPMQGVVLGLLVASIVAVPISISQLFRFGSALPFLLAVLIFAHLPWMAFTLLFSCILASVRPFRMKFRYGSALVAMLPVVLYLVLATRPPTEEGSIFTSPQQRFMLVAPWILAILAACAMTGAILIIARMVNYRPGAVLPVMAVMFATPVVLFHRYVGVDELDYRVLELNYGPRSARFDPVRDATPYINSWLVRYTDPEIHDERRRLAVQAAWSGKAAGLAELKRHFVREMELELLTDRRDAFAACKEFIADHPNSPYIPNVLFIQARTLDLRLDERRLIGDSAQRELYTDFPHAQSDTVWTALLTRFPDSPLAIAARLRAAQLRLRRGEVEPAERLLATMGSAAVPSAMPASQPNLPSMLRPDPPEASLNIDPAPYLTEARRLLELIAANREDSRYGGAPLAALAALDFHRPGYTVELARLGQEFPGALLADNLAVRWALSADSRAEQLAHLEACLEQFPNGDAAAEALYRLGDLESQATGADGAARRAVGRARLQEVLRRYGDTSWAADAAERLRLLEPGLAHAGEARDP